jgi:hypothetical protein
MAQYRNLSIHVDKGNQSHVIGMSIRKRYALAKPEAQADFLLSSFTSVMAPQMRSADREWGNSKITTKVKEHNKRDSPEESSTLNFFTPP